jgi:hypothetical protein
MRRNPPRHPPAAPGAPKTAALLKGLTDVYAHMMEALRLVWGTHRGLTVALAVQTGDWPTALKIAEQDKNALLRQGLLSNQPAQSPDYGQMQTFLQQQPQTAILYWHLSANALTTFLLTGDQVEAITSDFSQLIALETWIKTWKKDYPTDKKETNKPPLSR